MHNFLQSNVSTWIDYLILFFSLQLLLSSPNDRQSALVSILFCAKKRDFLTAGASACRQSLWIHICTVPYSIKVYKSRADYKQQKQNAWLFMVPRNICPFMYMYRSRYKHVIKISMWGNIFIVTLTLLIF